MHEKKMCPVGTEIQTLIFAHEAFKNEDYVKAWARANNFKYGAVDETDDSWRIRQQEPEHFIEKSFRTIPITDGVKAVIGCPIHKLATGGFTNCGCFKKKQGGSLKTEYEELMSFTKLKDINYFKKKYSDEQTQSSWLKPLQQYFVKASAHLSAERKKDEPNQDAVAFLKEQVRILEPMNTDFYKEVTKKEYATGGELTWMQDGNSEQQSSTDLAKELEELNKGVQYCLGQIAEAKEKWVKDEYKVVMNDRLKRIHQIHVLQKELAAQKKQGENTTVAQIDSPEIWKHKHMNATAKILGETAKGYKVELTDNTYKKPKVTTQYFGRGDFKGDKAIFEKQNIWGGIELPEDHKHKSDALSIGEKIANVLGKKLLRITGEDFEYSKKREESIDIIYNFADSTSVKLVGKPYDGYLLCIFYHDITAPGKYRMYKSSEEYDLSKKEDVFTAVNEILHKIENGYILHSFSDGGKFSPAKIEILNDFLKKYPPAIEVWSAQYRGGSDFWNTHQKDLAELFKMGIEVETVDYNKHAPSFWEINYYDADLMETLHPIQANMKKFEMVEAEINKQLAPFNLHLPKYTEYASGGAVDSFSYRMLGRLITDNDYFLGNGNRSEKVLWAGSVDAQIAEMKRLWNQLPEKPEWLSMEEILKYERKMKNPKLGKGGNLKFNAGGRIKGEIETGDTFSKILPQYYKGEVVDHIHKPIIIEAIKDDMVHFSPKSILTNGKVVYVLHLADFRKELNTGTIKSFDVATVNGETDQNMNSFISDIGQLMPFEMSELESVKQKFDLDSVDVKLNGTRSMIDGSRTTNTVINISRKSINNFREISITKISSGSLPDQFEKILVREVDNNDHNSYFVYNSIQDFCDNHFTRMKLGGSMKTVVLTETESPYAQLVISARDKHSFDRRTCARIEADDNISEVQYMNMLDAVARTYGLDASSFENKSIGDYKQAIFDAAKNTVLHVDTSPVAGSINFDKTPVSFWNSYLTFVEGMDGIISEHGKLLDSYWKKGVQEELDRISSAVKTKADIVQNKVRIINNATDLLDGLTGAISSGKISSARYFKPGAISQMRKLLAHKYENGGSAGGLDVPLFSKDEMAIMRQVYNDRINGLLGKKSYLDTSNAKEWHSENNLSLTAAKQNADKELDEIKSDIEYLNSQKYPFELISSAYDCEKFLNDYNDLVKTKAGRELFGEDNPVSARLYDVYLSLYDKLVQFCEKKFNRSF